MLLLAGLLMSACGGETSPTQQGNSGPNGSGSPGPTVPGSKTANPFFTPSEPSTSAAPAYTLEFDYKPGVPVIDASVTAPLPQGQPDDWSITIDGSGTAKYTKNPRGANGGTTTQHTLTQDKINALLQQLNGLGVLQWPETTAPENLAAGGNSRSLHLYLKGRTKAITDLSGGSGDALAQMLDLIQKTVNDAPTK
jgi:hypothetical protein